ncbi:RluA family pseudouridine synthase [Palleronia abyssalis]|uniref:Pseudouridine synthase n=1 Tax=Palleronia abyssalis TaxID=1501240 RepID=A0A2R8BUY6_9RHOB|nr:RluA family pseudouridine synthase [Palleronia abyssalis]SPJ23971.1 Ribosomal large subunit pseudouridine synthase D [Palleronia abyssalis]
MSQRLVVTIGENPPARLDKALARDVPEQAHLSRSRLARLIGEGAVSRDGRVLDSPKAQVEAGQEITVVVPDEAETEMRAEDIPLNIVHEDADLVVVDKPAGMVVHPAPGSPSGTLVNALLHHFDGRLSGVGGEKRPGIVHRIDKDTSGLLVVAKTDRAHHGLAEQFAAHSVMREYLALCHGVPSPSDPRMAGMKGVHIEGNGIIRISSGLARHPTDRQRQAVTFDGGRHAVTRVRLQRDWGAVAMVTCRLETGRTHQIRVHMRHVGHPLVGDQTYGGQRRVSVRLRAAEAVNQFARQALHARELGFVHPGSGERMIFTSRLPIDLQGLVDELDDVPGDTNA